MTHKKEMRLLALVVTLGVILVILPAMGFPSRIDDRFVFVIGAALIVTGMLLRRGVLARESSTIKEDQIKIETK